MSAWSSFSKERAPLHRVESPPLPGAQLLTDEEPIECPEDDCIDYELPPIEGTPEA